MKRRILPWIAGVLLCAFGIGRIALILPARSHQNDFAHYYVTSRLWVEGRDPYTTPFAPEFAKYGFAYDQRIPSGTNPPPLVALLAPIALLPPAGAFAAWVAIEMLSLILTLIMIAMLLRNRLPARMLPLILGLVVASSTLYFHFYFSQVQLLLGATLLGAYMLQRSGRYAAALALASVAALLKLFPLAVIPWFLLVAPGSLRTRAARLLPASAVVFLTVAVTWGLWPGFLHSGSTIVKDAITDQTFNFSLPSLIVNAGWAHYGFQPAAADAARLWLAANAAAALLLAAAYGTLYWLDLSLENGFCVVMLAATVASPTAWGHYFVLAFFPFCVFAARMLHTLTVRRLIAFGLMYAVTINLGDGVCPTAQWSALIKDTLALPYTLRIACAYVPLFGVLGLAGWFGFEGRLFDVKLLSLSATSR